MSWYSYTVLSPIQRGRIYAPGEQIILHTIEDNTALLIAQGVLADDGTPATDPNPPEPPGPGGGASGWVDPDFCNLMLTRISDTEIGLSAGAAAIQGEIAEFDQTTLALEELEDGWIYFHANPKETMASNNQSESDRRRLPLIIKKSSGICWNFINPKPRTFFCQQSPQEILVPALAGEVELQNLPPIPVLALVSFSSGMAANSTGQSSALLINFGSQGLLCADPGDGFQNNTAADTYSDGSAMNSSAYRWIGHNSKWLYSFGKISTFRRGNYLGIGSFFDVSGLIL